MAERQIQGDVSDTHRVYWDEGMLYGEAWDFKPGATRRVMVPQLSREFIPNLAHGIPFAGHQEQAKTCGSLVSHFYWPQMYEKIKEFCCSCITCQANGKTGGKPKAPLSPLPVVGVPFERVVINIVGPLDPQTASGNTLSWW